MLGNVTSIDRVYIFYNRLYYHIVGNDTQQYKRNSVKKPYSILIFYSYGKTVIDQFHENNLFNAIFIDFLPISMIFGQPKNLTHI